MPSRDYQNPVMERHECPEMVLILQELARQARVRKRPDPVAINGHQEECEQAYVWDHYEQELIKKMLAHFNLSLGRRRWWRVDCGGL